MRDNFRKWVVVLGAIVAASFFAPGVLFSQAPFYQGKTITLVVSLQPGGTGDMRIRSVVPFLEKYIPGRPTIALEYMPGGGGRKAANHLYNRVRPDGLTIVNGGTAFVSNAVLGLPGVDYDIDKVIYLGVGDSRTSWVFLTRREAGLDTLEKLRAASGLRVGAQSVGHTIYITGRLFAWIIPLKDPRFVTGYSGPELDLALMRGEVDARVNIPDTVVDRSPDWIEKGLVHFHAVLENPKGFRHEHPVYRPLPSLESLTRTDAQGRVLAMLRNFRLIGSPYLLPPGVPKERADILKEAFRKTFNDPDFFKVYRRLTGGEASPLTPEEQERTIKEIPREREVIDLFNKIAGADPLSLR